MSKKATLADIIAKKKQGEMDKLQVNYYQSELLGMDIEVRKIPLARFLELTEEEGSTIDNLNKMLFECCPMFRENTKEAMEVYDVSVPTDLPSAVFEDNINEMNEVVSLINEFYGIKEKEIETIIKN